MDTLASNYYCLSRRSDGIAAQTANFGIERWATVVAFRSLVFIAMLQRGGNFDTALLCEKYFFGQKPDNERRVVLTKKAMVPLRTLVVLLNIDFISGWGPPGQGLLYAKGHLMEEADFVAEEEVAGIESVAVCAAMAK